VKKETSDVKRQRFNPKSQRRNISFDLVSTIDLCLPSYFIPAIVVATPAKMILKDCNHVAGHHHQHHNNSNIVMKPSPPASDSIASSPTASTAGSVGKVNRQSVWVFGYGSLVWRPGFQFDDTRIGFVRGFARRFWQGNDVHRGSCNQLGRVVTLIEEDGAETWGRAFLLRDEEAAKEYLNHRETDLGGYTTLSLNFSCVDGKTMQVLVYVALPNNPLFLGPAPLITIANEIILAQGVCGHNVEYLANLAAFMRIHVPEDRRRFDDHLVQLDFLVQSLITSDGQLSHLQVHFDEAENRIPVFDQDALYFPLSSSPDSESRKSLEYHKLGRSPPSMAAITEPEKFNR